MFRVLLQYRHAFPRRRLQLFEHLQLEPHSTVLLGRRGPVGRCGRVARWSLATRGMYMKGVRFQELRHMSLRQHRWQAQLRSPLSIKHGNDTGIESKTELDVMVLWGRREDRQHASQLDDRGLTVLEVTFPASPLLPH